MKVLYKLTFIICTIILSQFSSAQLNDTILIQRIISTIKTKGHAYSILRILTDSIGGRITGTPESKKTSAFLVAKLKAFGYENAHLEDYELKTSWAPNAATGRIVSPGNQPLVVSSYGWCPGTRGEINARIVDLGFYQQKTIPEIIENVRGAAVIFEPSSVGGQPGAVRRLALANALAKSGAVAMLIPSDKPNRLLDIGCLGFYPAGPLPVLSIAKEDVLLLRRILERQTATITLDINNSFSTKATKEYNVAAEIPGTDSADIILMGAHFDSWNGGQGAQDNGSGVAAIMEVARVFKLLDIKPGHTIRFVFFSGEEQGILGSNAYVIKHNKELDKIHSIIIMDHGTEAPKGFHIQGRTDMDSIYQTAFKPLSALGASGISANASFDTDHAPFISAGIPALTLWVNEGNYGIAHSIADTYDKVDPGLLAADAAVLAVALYTLDKTLQAKTYRLSVKDTEILMKKNGLEPWQIIFSTWWHN